MKAALTAVIALGSVLAASSALRAQPARFPELSPSAPAGSGEVATCTVPGLREGVRCGRFRVLEDRGRPAGRTLDLAFVILEALAPGVRTEDAIILLPGGPGESFSGAALRVSGEFRELRQARDILLVDVRGPP